MKSRYVLRNNFPNKLNNKFYNYWKSTLMKGFLEIHQMLLISPIASIPKEHLYEMLLHFIIIARIHTLVTAHTSRQWTSSSSIQSPLFPESMLLIKSIFLPSSCSYYVPNILYYHRRALDKTYINNVQKTENQQLLAFNSANVIPKCCKISFRER